MSLGFIGFCRKESEDDSTIYYAYSGANWNDKSQNKNYEKSFDGVFAIDKSVLRWKASCPHKQTESIDWTYNAIDSGLAVVIRECQNSFRLDSIEMDYIAHRLLLKIFEELHKTEFPENAAFIQ